MAIWRVSRLARVLLGLGAFLLVLAPMAFSAYFSSTNSRIAFAELNAIKEPAVFPDEPITIRAKPIYGVSVAGRSISVIAAEPLGADATPPFLLSVWPARGEFLVSPDLLGDVQELEPRFGTFTGALPLSALPSANSRMVFVRPLVPLPDSANAAGFGLPPAYANLATSNPAYFPGREFPATVTLPMLALGTLIPASSFLIATIAWARRQNAKTIHVLEVVGTRPKSICNLFFREISKSLLVGIANAWLLLIFAVTFGVRVPAASFALRSIDIRLSLPLFVTGGLVGTTLALVIAWVASYPPQIKVRDSEKRKVSNWLNSSWLAALSASAVILVAQMGLLAANATSQTGLNHSTPILIAGGTLLAIIVAPIIGNALLHVFSDLLVARGHAKGSATNVVLGRSLVGWPQSRNAVAIGATLILLGGLGATLSRIGSANALDARQLARQVAEQYTTIAIPPDRADSVNRFLAAISDDYGVIQIAQDVTLDADNRPVQVNTIAGTQEALSHWGLPLDTAILGAELPTTLNPTISVSSDSTIQIVQLDDDSEFGSTIAPNRIAVFHWDGSPIVQTQIERLVSETIGVDVNSTLGGASWIVGANDLVFATRWFTWFTIVGGSILSIAAFLRIAEDQRRQIMTTMPVESMFSAESLGRKVLLGRLVVISLITLIVGAIPAVLFARVTTGGLTTTDNAYLPVLVVTLVSLAILALFVLPQVIELRRIGTAWAPSRKDYW